MQLFCDFVQLCLVLLAIGIQAQGPSYGSGDRMGGMGEGGMGEGGMGGSGMGGSPGMGEKGMGEKGMGPSGSKSGSMMAGQGVFASKWHSSLRPSIYRRRVWSVFRRKAGL